ncbi:hypothetical protein ACH5RR_011391 [Cinchona calisaya]|uniref:Dof zinc finger protein n=1 Tax=Cinchona calisaya TaxID=153742 RepID=A0ABD3A872_9GENT
MMQELLGEAAAELIGGERSKNISSPSLSSSTVTTPTTNSSTSETLRCPRCDSINTKFCYYNNYNLTQPRHFCKTCLRYWTKGGALRNVPIGGGCRKNKATTSSVIKSSAAGKFKTITIASSDTVKLSGFMSGFEHKLPSSSNPISWASPQNSRLLSLLSANQNPNPEPISNLLSNSLTVKEEADMHGSHVLELDSVGLQIPPIGIISSSGFVLGGDEWQSTGVQDFYQRLRSSSASYYPDHAPPVGAGNVVSSCSSSSSLTILDSGPIATEAEYAYWNPILSWSDHLPTTNGAYP